MKLGKLTFGFAAVALLAAPVLAQATLAPAIAPLSGDEAELSGEEVIIGVLVTSAVVGGAIIAGGGGDDEPLSP